MCDKSYAGIYIYSQIILHNTTRNNFNLNTYLF